MFSPSAHQDSPIQTISQLFLTADSTEPLYPKWWEHYFILKRHGWTELFIFPYKSVFLAGEEGRGNIHACIGKLLEGSLSYGWIGICGGYLKEKKDFLTAKFKWNVHQ